MIEETSNTSPIFDEQYERAVIGSLLSNSRAMDEVRDVITAECFHSSLNADIFKAIMDMDMRGDDPNMITIIPELARRGVRFTPMEAISLTQCAVIGSLYPYVARLIDLSARRKMLVIAQRLMAGAMSEIDDVLDIQMEAKEAIDDIFRDNRTHIVSLKESTKELLEQVQCNMASGSGLIGTMTGFREIDNRGGLQATDLIIIAGETSMGKTSFANTIVSNAIGNGSRIAFYSMEMMRVQLTARMVSAKSGIPSSEILYQRISPEHFEHVYKGACAISDGQLFFDDDSTSNLDKIISSIRTVKIKHNIEGAVIDYLQILNVNIKSQNKEQAMGDASRRLKNLAKDLGIWIIALSQLSRNRDNPVPTLNRLRDSGQIAEAADMVMLVYRPEAVTPPVLAYPEPFTSVSTKGTAMINVAKGRNFGMFSFIVQFDAPTTHFKDLPVPLSNNRFNYETPF